MRVVGEDASTVGGLTSFGQREQKKRGAIPSQDPSSSHQSYLKIDTLTDRVGEGRVPPSLID